MSTPPHAPTSNSRIELYTQEPMVNWLGPIELIKTGIRAAVATTLGAFADPREVQAALHPRADNPPMPVPGGAEGEVWIDYLAAECCCSAATRSIPRRRGPATAPAF
jgi:hypothetical protein